jgi:hypothetical protein
MARLASIVCAAALGATLACGAATGAPAHVGGCQSVANVCYGTIPPVRKKVVLRPRNGSREHGTAWITFGFHNTAFVLEFHGAPRASPRSLSLRLGGCSSRRVVYYLGGVADGRRVVQADAVPRLSGFALVVRAGRSTSGGPVVACGVIPFEK